MFVEQGTNSKAVNLQSTTGYTISFITKFQILYISTKICTFDMYDYYKTILLLYVLTTLVQGSLNLVISPKRAAAS